ncbi:hypothetical protein [Nocardia higoensis]|uniref:hypothetical protein n=1 Tax=Nocardia higoensis TaxID=228599 RepID=UPI0002D40461|nr:hypothetical protein [Nocardia higoensis]
MPRPSAHEHRPDAFTEFAEELRVLAETVLERVEPALRGAAEDRPEWSSCSWCPVCATAALLRGEHHDVLTALADHGTAIVTVLREALAGAPVEPVLPTEDDTQRHHRGSPTGTSPEHDAARTSSGKAGPNPNPVGHPDDGPDSAGDPDAAADLGAATTATSHATQKTARRPADDRSEGRPGGVGDPSRSARRGPQPRKRSGYTAIPVTIRT